MNFCHSRSESFARGGDEAGFGIEVADLLGAVPGLGSRSQARMHARRIRRVVRGEMTGICRPDGGVRSIRVPCPPRSPASRSRSSEGDAGGATRADGAEEQA